MNKLAEECGETVILASIDRAMDLVTYINVIESKNLVRSAVPAGISRPMYCSAGGCVLLAYQSEEWREADQADSIATRMCQV